MKTKKSTIVFLPVLYINDECYKVNVLFLDLMSDKFVKLQITILFSSTFGGKAHA